MKNLILSVLILVCPLLAKAACDPVTFEGCFCSPSTPEGCNVDMPEMPLFASHLDAEGNYFHCAEGIALWGGLIKQLEPSFEPVLPSDYVNTRINQDCSGKIQIYSTQEDDINTPFNESIYGVCSIFKDQQEAEKKYLACQLTNYQYWDKLQSLQKAAKGACASPSMLKDGANRGNLWKPIADPKARCKNGTTVLLDPKYADVTKLSLLASSQKDKGLSTGELGDVGLAEYFGFVGSRPRFCFRFPGSKFGPNPVYLSFTSNGQGQCLKVGNASNRED